jgi:predicted lactoylglutathione lyase
MSRKIFINLPVQDLTTSVDFFTQLGFAFDSRFTDESATCMIISDHAYAMLLVAERFKDFTTKAICDTVTHTEALFALSVDSREQVDTLVNTALAAGAQPHQDPQDHGFMYGWGFQDLDGHVWEVFFMDDSAART